MAQGDKIAVSPWMQKVFDLDTASIDVAPSHQGVSLRDYLNSLRPMTAGEAARATAGGLLRGYGAAAGSVMKGIAVASQRIDSALGLDSADVPPEERSSYAIGNRLETGGANLAGKLGLSVDRPHAASIGSFIAEDIAPALGGAAPAVALGPAQSLAYLGATQVAQQAMSGYAQAKAEGADDETAWRAFLWNMPIGAAYLLGPGRQVAGLSKALAAVEAETGRSLSRFMLGTAIGAGEMATASALGDLVGQKLGYTDGVDLEKALKAGAVGGTMAAFFGAAIEATRAKKGAQGETSGLPATENAGGMPGMGQEPREPNAGPSAQQAQVVPRAAAKGTAPLPRETAATDPQVAAREAAAIDKAVQAVAAERGYPMLRRVEADTPEAQFFEEWMTQHGKAAVGIEPPAGQGRRFTAATKGDVVIYNAATDPKVLQSAVLYHEGFHGLPDAAQERLARGAEAVDPQGWREAGVEVAQRYGPDAAREGTLATYGEKWADWLAAGERRPDKLRALIEHDPGVFTVILDGIKKAAQKLGFKVQTSLERKIEEFGNLDAGPIGPQAAARLVRSMLDEFEALRGSEPEWLAQPKQAETPRAAETPKAPVETKTVQPEAQAAEPEPKAAAPETAPAVRGAGRRAELELPTGQSKPVTYRIVDARELVPSHDPTKGYVRNPAGDINERDYGHPVEGRAYRDTVEKIAANPKPGLVLTDTPSASDGPPIVGPGMRVLGGNARSMGLQLAYEKGGKGAARLREAALDAAERFGIKRADVEGIERPVLVRELSEADAGAPGEMSRILNQPLTTAKTANTEAVSRGSKLDHEAATEIAKTIGDGTLREAMGDAKSTGELLRSLVKSGAFTDADLTALVDSRGLLTQSGRDIVEQTLLGSVVTNLATLAELPPSTRQMVLKSLPHLIRTRSVWPEFGVTMQNALEAVIAARANGGSLLKAKTQTLLIGETAWKSDARAIALAERMLSDTQTEFARRMFVLVEGMTDAEKGQAGLFEERARALTPDEAFAEAVTAKDGGTAEGVRSGDEPGAQASEGAGGGPALFALSPSRRRTRSLPEHDAIARANTAVVESFHRVHEIEPLLAAPNTRNKSVRRTEELMHGKIAHHDQWVEQNYVDVVTEAMRDGQIHVSDDAPGRPAAGKYLTALHAPQRNDLMRRRHPRKFGLRANPGSGMTDLEAAAVVREAHTGPAAAQYRAIAEANRKLNEHSLQLAVETGLVSAEHADTLRQEFGADYVPLKTHYEGAIEYMGAAHSLGVTGKEFKRAEGRMTEADNPLVFQIQDKLRLMRRAEKNRVDLALREAVIRNPNMALWKYRQSRDSIDVADWEAGRVLTFKFGGQDRFVVFHDAALAEAFKSLEKTISGSAVRVIDTVNRWLRGTIIKYNPVWAIVNPVRDVLTAIPKAAAKYGPAFAFDVARNQAAAGIGAFRAMRDPNAKGYWADRYREMSREGGLVSWADVITWGERLKKLEAEVERGGTMQTLHEAGRWLAALTTASEMGTRLSAADAALRRGASRSEAAWIMRNVTVDFARHGTWAPVYGRLYLFSGANIQGARSSVAWLRSNPRRAAAVFGTMIGMGYALASASRMFADENESGINEFDARKDGELSRKLGVMIGKTYIGLPMPWFFGMFFNLGRRMEQARNGRLTTADVSQGVALDAVQSFSPVQGANLLQAVTPTFFRPAVELAQNQDFAGRIIYSDPFPTDPTPPPQSQRALRDVSPALKAVTDALNRATGGDEINPGAIDINPEWIEHIVKFAMGGVGAQSGYALSVAEKVWRGDEWAVTDLPVVHSFASSGNPNLHKSLFRDTLSDIEYAHETAKRAAGLGEEVSPEVRHLDGFFARARAAQTQARALAKRGREDDALKVMQAFNRTFEAARQ